jgi:hypothetical protein
MNAAESAMLQEMQDLLDDRSFPHDECVSCGDNEKIPHFGKLRTVNRNLSIARPAKQSP